MLDRCFNVTIMLMQESQNTTEEVIERPRSHISTYVQLACVSLLVFVVALNSLYSRTSAYLTTRSMAVSSSMPGVITTHNFQFGILGTPSVGSIAFEYCSNSPLLTVPCVAPVGLDTAASALASQTGETGFSIHPDTLLTSNKIIITRPPVAITPGTVTYGFSNITNPTSSLGTTYVRITTYPTIDASGILDDSGSVTFSIQNPLTVSVYVPPFLTLCTGVTVDVDCSLTNGISVDMGELSKTNTNTATTQFSIATNSVNGYVASMQGSTMTAGNRTISALTLPTTSQVGVAQFGLNLRANTQPAVGSDVVGGGTGTVSANYSTPNLYRFQTGDVIASSLLSTEFNRYTISYIVNIPEGQPAGRYASTLTVIATTTF